MPNGEAMAAKRPTCLLPPEGDAAAGATAHASGSAAQCNSSVSGRVASSIFIQNSARVSEAPAGRAKMQAV